MTERSAIKTRRLVQESDGPQDQTNSIVVTKSYPETLKTSRSLNELTLFERLALGHTTKAMRAPKFRHPVNDKLRFRLFNIQKLIKSRHGDMIPETDDTAYIEAVAANTRDLEFCLSWSEKWSPWMPAETVRATVLAVTQSRNKDLKSDEIARLLCVKYDERQRLGLNTIGATDKTKAELDAIAKERKKQQDRDRQRLKRAEKGCVTRSEYEHASAEKLKPWIDCGMSRATWYRKLKNARETRPSKVNIYITEV